MEPVLLLVVANAASRGRLVDELGRYRRDYRIETAADGEHAIVRLRALRSTGVPVAMVLADLAVQPGDGIDLLARVRTEVPTAKRILLLDWGLHGEQVATIAARATSQGVLDTVLTKPSGPRDEEFHGTITEELGEWAWSTSPTVEAIRVIVDDDVRRGVEIRDLLERLGAPTGVHALDSPVGQELAEAAGPGARLPLVEVMGRTVLADPTNRELAVAFGAVVDVADTVFDLAIVGAGPAGLGAAVYGASEGLTTLIIEREAFGGQAGTSSMIRNYLGFPRGVTGRQLGRRGIIQATRFGAALDMGRDVIGLEPGDPHQLRLSDGAVATARAVILACGVSYRRLGVPSIEDLVGAGVFYGTAASQARDLEGLAAVVIGAGNSGGQAAVHLARHGVSVTLVARGTSLHDTMSAYLVTEIAGEQRIEVRTATDVVDGGGEGRLEWVELADRATGERRRIETAAMFVLIGADSRTAWLPSSIERDEQGFVLTGADIDPTRWSLSRPPFALETSAPGVFAAGDLRANGVKRVAAAAGEGAVSVPMVHRYLS